MRERERLTVRLPVDLMMRLREASDETGRPMNTLIGEAIYDSLEASYVRAAILKLEEALGILSAKLDADRGSCAAFARSYGELSRRIGEIPGDRTALALAETDFAEVASKTAAQFERVALRHADLLSGSAADLRGIVEDLVAIRERLERGETR